MSTQVEKVTKSMFLLNDLHLDLSVLVYVVDCIVGAADITVHLGHVVKLRLCLEKIEYQKKDQEIKELLQVTSA